MSLGGKKQEIEPAEDTFDFMDLLGRYPDDPVKNRAQWDKVGVHLRKLREQETAEFEQTQEGGGT